MCPTIQLSHRPGLDHAVVCFPFHNQEAIRGKAISPEDEVCCQSVSPVPPPPGGELSYISSQWKGTPYSLSPHHRFTPNQSYKTKTLKERLARGLS